MCSLKDPTLQEQLQIFLTSVAQIASKPSTNHSVPAPPLHCSCDRGGARASLLSPGVMLVRDMCAILSTQQAFHSWSQDVTSQDLSFRMPTSLVTTLWAPASQPIIWDEGVISVPFVLEESLLCAATNTRTAPAIPRKFSPSLAFALPLSSGFPASRIFSTIPPS